MTKIKLSLEGMNVPKGRFVSYQYPDCIVNRITRAFVFKESKHGFEAINRDGINREWTNNSVVMETYIEFVRFVCDFMINEMVGLPLLKPASVIDDVIDVIIDNIQKFGETPNGCYSDEEDEKAELELEAELRKNMRSFNGEH